MYQLIFSSKHWKLPLVNKFEKRVKIGLKLNKLGEFGQKRGQSVPILGEFLPQGEFFPTGGGVRIFEFYLPVALLDSWTLHIVHI